MLFDGAVFTLMVKVAVVQVVDVAVVLDGGVAAAFAVLMGIYVAFFGVLEIVAAFQIKNS